MHDSTELLRMHVGALFTQNEAGRLLRVNEPNGAPAPRFFLGRTNEENHWWFREDISDDIASELDATCAVIPVGMDLSDQETLFSQFVTVLERVAPVRARWSGPAFNFASPVTIGPWAIRITTRNVDVLRAHLASWREDVLMGRLLFAVVIDGAAVSVCGSVRETELAHEAGVETAPPFRGQGYGAQAVSAWASAVRTINRVPLYSTSWSNTSSRALARRLGLTQFASDFHLT